MAYNQPDNKGYFGEFGGMHVAEFLMPSILALKDEYEEAKKDPKFWKDFNYYLKHYVGRPSPLFYAERFSEHLGGAKIYFKRDELNHTGAHKINNAIGQILMAKRLNKTRIIAETGAGQHGVATATVCTLFGLKCTIYMGEKDVERQKPNVFRMKLLGAEVISVPKDGGTLKGAMNEAMRDWVANANDTYYLLGTAAGPHPYPMMVRDFQSVIGTECKQQILEAENKLPDLLVATVGGGSNSIGLFYPFIDDIDTKIVAVEAAGKGIDSTMHAASINTGKPAILHGNLSYYIQDEQGNIKDTHSISAGLDYPGVGPEHAYLHSTGRVQYELATDDEALNAFQLCCKLEGIIPALEPSHSLAYIIKQAPKMSKDEIIIVNICGRGDKDMGLVMSILNQD